MLEINLNSVVIGNSKPSVDDEYGLKEEENKTNIYALESTMAQTDIKKSKNTI